MLNAVSAAESHKVAHDLLAVVGEHALGMELHAFDGKLPMPQSHDHALPIAVVTDGRDLQFVRQALLFDDQRMVARGGHGRRNAAEDCLAVVFNGAGFAVHQRACADHLPAEGLADGLVAEAHAQHGHAPGKMPDQFDADSGVLRRARAGRDNDAVGMKFFNLADGDLVIAPHHYLFSQFAQVLDQVVGERVVVVQDEDHGSGSRFEIPQVRWILVWSLPLRFSSQSCDCGPTLAEIRIDIMARLQSIARLMAVLACIASSVVSATAQVQRIGALSAVGASDELKHAVEAKGYRVTLDDGWTADFWFVLQLKTVMKDVPGALYPELANGEFVGVVNLPKGMNDFRGQAIPAGVYTLRYQLLPQDGNHLGVAPNPDFLLAIPVASDPNPEQSYLYRKLVTLSAKSTGTNHPAVIALDSAGEPGSIAKDSLNVTVFSVTVTTSAGATEKLGIVVKGVAGQ